MIETLLSDKMHLVFECEIEKLLDKGYKIVHINTVCDSCDRIIWTALLKK